MPFRIGKASKEGGPEADTVSATCVLGGSETGCSNRTCTQPESLDGTSEPGTLAEANAWPVVPPRATAGGTSAPVLRRTRTQAPGTRVGPPARAVGIWRTLARPP